MHNHILPGIDDGSASPTESTVIRQQLADWGIERAIYTPHILTEVHPNTPQSISAAYQDLMHSGNYQKSFTKDSFAAEYMLDEEFKRLLERKEPLLCLKDNYLLVELPLNFQNYFLDSLIFEIFLSGYQPVLAHPERYIYFHQKRGMYQRLKDMGCLFQLNLLSLSNYYSKNLKSQAEKLLKADMVDFIATDIHHANQLPLLEKLLSAKDWRRWANYPFQNVLFSE